MARVRSPNYPQLSLPAAIERVAHVFKKEHTHAAPREVIAAHLGYSTLNGASLSAISALAKYGLLDKDGEGYKVSSRALAILHPSSPAERSSALAEAASAPALFAELMTNFDGHLPSDENLKSYLIRRGYSPNVITSVVQILRDTWEYVGDLVAPRSADATVPTQVSPVPVSTAELPQPALLPTSRGPVLRVSLENGCIHVAAALTQKKEIDQLVQLLQAYKAILPDGVEDGASEPQSQA